MDRCKKYIYSLLAVFIFYPTSYVYSAEQIISVEELSENIIITFEAAPKDTVFNDSIRQLSENMKVMVFLASLQMLKYIF